MKGYVLCVVFCLGLGGSAWAAEVICPRLYCFAFCPYGFLTNRKGCPSCSCSPPQVARTRTCQDEKCFVPCDRGYQLDSETGCLTCVCAPDSVVDPKSLRDSKKSAGLIASGPGQSGPDCNEIRCLIACPNGDYQMDSQGCPSCECAASSSSSSSSKTPPPDKVSLREEGANVNCPERFCFSPCPNGFMKDKYGCASCSCLPDQEASSRTCQDHQCFMACDNGYKLDRDTGCLTCTCAPDSVVDPKPSSSSSSSDDKNPGFVAPGQLDPQCNEIRCLMPCDKGDYLMDAKGCPTCVCESSPPSAKGFVKDTDDEDPSSGAGRAFPFWLPCLVTMLRLLFP